MPNVPSVTISGGMFNSATNAPLITPHPTPTSSPTATPTRITPHPELIADAAPPPTAIIVLAATTPENTSTEPTDRSMPAVMITYVIPTDSVSATAALTKIVLMSKLDKNELGFMIENTATITRRARKIHNGLAGDNSCARSRVSLVADVRSGEAGAAGVSAGSSCLDWLSGSELTTTHPVGVIERRSSHPRETRASPVRA